MANQPQWNQDVEHKYSNYFNEPRAAPPVDGIVGTSLTTHPGTRNPGLSTKTITLFNPAELYAVLGNNVRLDKAFVEDTLNTYGPIVDPRDLGDWSFNENPSRISSFTTFEPNFYAWYRWLVAYPVAHASNAVCHVLNSMAPTSTSTALRGPMKSATPPQMVESFNAGSSGAMVAPGGKPACCMNSNATTSVDGQHTLARLVELANRKDGYQFRAHSSREGKLFDFICHIIDEMIQAKTGHLVVATQTQYILVRLIPSLQLEISKVYSIRDSPTQLEDMAILVLFCTLAVAERVGTYPQETKPWRVYIPQFPTWMLQPHQGVFYDGAQQQQIEFRNPRKSFLLPLSWLALEGEVHSAANDVSVAFGQLRLFFIAARIVAKIAHGVAATQRLDREFLAYSALRDWQGVAIPRIFGMYISTDQTTKVLLMSDAGKALQDFKNLELADKHLLFARLVRLHQSGVAHNDFEPRNVTRSETLGPLIIDFDETSLDHVCTGVSCEELRRVAQVLQLDAAAELATLDPVTVPRLTYPSRFKFTFATLAFAVWSAYYFLHL
ncbi:hypothetical protein B0H12DRAFT_1153433 [Mycena haematopus]|nr:hypothetical protein B0H12DRAFT_1153433 [Mycena haematopus]